jgi:hypothetical protein
VFKNNVVLKAVKLALSTNEVADGFQNGAEASPDIATNARPIPIPLAPEPRLKEDSRPASPSAKAKLQAINRPKITQTPILQPRF